MQRLPFCAPIDGALATQEEKAAGAVPAYVILMNLTDQWIKDIKDAPARTAEAVEALQAAGGRLLCFYTCMGACDSVAIAEGPGDEVAMAQLLALGMGGNVRTTTMRAFNQEDLLNILAMLP